LTGDQGDAGPSEQVKGPVDNVLKGMKGNTGDAGNRGDPGVKGEVGIKGPRVCFFSSIKWNKFTNKIIDCFRAMTVRMA
jgi:hypothetical protein